jgi:hypothetical protein
MFSSDLLLPIIKIRCQAAVDCADGAESAEKHAPSLTTLKKYAHAVGCHLKIKFIPKSGSAKNASGGVKRRAG